MTDKQIKSNLKEAKEAIKNKDHPGALKLCKAVLREDRTNYMALVLLGAALQETEQRDQAPNAYRKATEANPTQTLAWQGLAAFYEKHDTSENKEELLKIYQKLISLESDATRKLDLTNKLALVAQRLGRIDVCVEALCSQQSTLHENIELMRDNWSRIASVLSAAQTLSTDLSILLEKALSILVDDSTSLENMENLRRYLRVLYQHRKLKTLAEWSQKSFALFPRAEFSLDWVCRAYSETTFTIDREYALEDLMPLACDNLLNLNPNSGFALLAKASHLFKQEKIDTARDVLMKASIISPLSPWVWVLLACTHSRLHSYKEAELSASYAKKYLNSCEHKTQHIIQSSIDRCMLLALSHQTDVAKLKECINIAEKVLTQDSIHGYAMEAIARAYVTLEMTNKAEESLKKIIHRPVLVAVLRAKLLSQQGEGEKALELLKTTSIEELKDREKCRSLALELSLKNESNIEQKNTDLISYDLDDNIWKEGEESNRVVAEFLVERGTLQRSFGDQSEALNNYLKAAQQDNFWFFPFVMLGNHYRNLTNRIETAIGSYQRALKFNPQCEEAGIGLSDIYRAYNHVEANKILLTNSAASGGKWAWFRLGLLHLQTGNTEEAISQFLATLRTEPNNSLCWESLGDAYMFRGAHTAAVKCFQKVMELDPKALYPAIQIASIKLLLGHFTEAEQEFRSVLQQKRDYVPALKGLGETCLSEARDFSVRQLNGRARDKCEEALNILTKAASIQNNLACVWKLMGDACMIPSEFGKDSHMIVCSSLVGETAKSAERKLVMIELDQMLQLATRCYCRALNLDENNSLAWHDLALSYVAQAKLVQNGTRKKLLEKSLAASHKATQLCPSNSKHWNLLGIIAAKPDFKQFSLAQHAFIKAVQLQSGNVEAWTNLGVLYLTQGDVTLANQAFAAAQRSEPAYLECWVGQALIAEGMDHMDAMDLFRHSTQLGTHTESSLGYASWVCRSLLSKADSPALKQMVAVAADVLIWYTERESENMCAYNMLGLLLERQGLFKSAAEILEKALKISQNTLEDVAQVDMVHTNLARVLSACGQHLEAVTHLKNLKETSFHSQCILAQAYFQAEMYKESYGAYESALHWLASDDAQKSQILVAKAAMAYKFQGPDGAKTLLFQCAQMQPPLVQGLFATCALGMLHSDLTLSKLVLKELKPYSDDPKFMTDIAIFQAYTFFLQNQWSESIRWLSKAVHRHPDHAPLWLSLALLLLHLHPNAPPNASAPCAGAALALGRSNMDISKVQSLVSLSHLLCGHTKASMREAQRAVHLFPDRAESWSVLVAAVLPRCEARRSKEEATWLKGTIGMVRRHQECSSRALSQWLSNYERKVHLLCDTF